MYTGVPGGPPGGAAITGRRRGSSGPGGRLIAPGDPGSDRLLTEQASSLQWAGRITDTEAISRSLPSRDLDPSLEGTVRVCPGR